MNSPIDNQIFDSRDLIEYKEFLEEEIVDYYNEYLEDYNQNADDDEQEDEISSFDEIVLLDGFVERFNVEIKHFESVKQFYEELEDYGDFTHGESIISEYYFTEYCENFIEDCGYIKSDLPALIRNNIDFDGIVEDMKADYMSIDFESTTYLMRA